MDYGQRMRAVRKGRSLCRDESNIVLQREVAKTEPFCRGQRGEERGREGELRIMTTLPPIQ
jgi:hypothetical protein